MCVKRLLGAQTSSSVLESRRKNYGEIRLLFSPLIKSNFQYDIDNRVDRQSWHANVRPKQFSQPTAAFNGIQNPGTKIHAPESVDCGVVFNLM
jgi:hypothetical protein